MWPLRAGIIEKYLCTFGDIRTRTNLQIYTFLLSKSMYSLVFVLLLNPYAYRFHQKYTFLLSKSMYFSLCTFGDTVRVQIAPKVHISLIEIYVLCKFWTNGSGFDVAIIILSSRILSFCLWYAISWLPPPPHRDKMVLYTRQSAKMKEIV
jgi:hypothetical protein